MEVKQIQKKRKLTAKQSKWAEVFVHTLNATEAARQVYNIGDNKNNLASVIGSENLSKPNIQEKIESLRSKMVDDSYFMYDIQKKILHQSLENDNLELGNKIINKVIDRAGLMPISKSESKHITAKFNFRRGINQQPTQSSSQELSPHQEANKPDVA